MLSRNYFESFMGHCPYLESRFWTAQNFFDSGMTACQYEYFLNKGFRRAGILYRKNICKTCDSCKSLKVDVTKFKLSRSQRRVLSKNSEVIAKIEDKVLFNHELYHLYNRYAYFKHNQKQLFKTTFEEIFINNPDFSKIIKFYLANKLIAASWIDILPNGISSVYSAYLPEYSHLSLGVYTALYELNLAATQNLGWYYLGYWVKGSSKMEYKKNYQPCYILEQGEWKYLSKQI